MNNTVPWALSHTQLAIEVVATLAFALSGVLEGARKKLDAVGICVVAGLAAFGGGTIRDVLLDRRPLFWIEHAAWIWALLALCIGAMVFMRARHLEPTERAMQWPDAMGLGLFTAGGTQIALDAHMPALIAVILGMVTAVFGGVLRDIVCNEIPRAFSDHRPYAVCAFAGGWTLVPTRVGTATVIGAACCSSRCHAAARGSAGLELATAQLASGHRPLNRPGRLPALPTMPP